MKRLKAWWDSWAGIGATGLVVVLFMAAIVGVWYGCSALEARAYNRITGKNVSAWDAMFVELRVQEGAK